MRMAKTEELKQDIEILSQSYDRNVDRKDALIQVCSIPYFMMVKLKSVEPLLMFKRCHCNPCPCPPSASHSVLHS